MYVMRLVYRDSGNSRHRNKSFAIHVSSETSLTCCPKSHEAGHQVQRPGRAQRLKLQASKPRYSLTSSIRSTLATTCRLLDFLIWECEGGAAQTEWTQTATLDYRVFRLTSFALKRFDSMHFPERKNVAASNSCRCLRDLRSIANGPLVMDH
jgi:hypothetical protein